MLDQDPDPRDLKKAVDEVDEAFDVAPLSAKGDDSRLDRDDKRETSGEVPVDNLE